MIRYIIGLLAIAIGAFSIVLIINLANPPSFDLPPDVIANSTTDEYPVNRFYEHAEAVKYDPTQQVRFVHRVTWNSKDNLYVYHYRIEHDGKDVVFLNWRVLDVTFGEAEPLIIQLNPGSVEEITMKSPFPPQPFQGGVIVFAKHQHDALPSSLWKMLQQEEIMGPIPVEPEEIEEPEEVEEIDQ